MHKHISLLHFTHLGAVAHTADVWDEDDLPAVLDDVRCDGTEEELLFCEKTPIDYRDSDFFGYAGVRCMGKKHTKNKYIRNCTKIITNISKSFFRRIRNGFLHVEQFDF